MAKKLDAWPKGRQMRGQYGSYPWNEWMDGDIWMLKHGEDFFADPRSMRIMCYNVGKKMGLKVNTALESNGVLYIKAKNFDHTEIK